MDDKARSDRRRSSRGTLESVRSVRRSNESGSKAKDVEQRGEEKRKVIRKLNKAISSLEKQLKSDTQNDGRDYLLAQEVESYVPEVLRAIQNELQKDEKHHGQNDPQYVSASDSALSESLYENSSLTSRAIPSDEKDAGTPVEQSLSRTLVMTRQCLRELSHLSLSRQRERLQSRVIQNTLASVEDERDEARRKNRSIAAQLENTEAKYEKLKASTWKWEEDKIRLRAETENIEIRYRNRVSREEEWMRMCHEEEASRLQQRTSESAKRLEEWAKRERELLEEMDTMRARHEESLSLLRDTNKTLRDRVNDMELQLDGQKRSFQASSDQWRSETLKNENMLEKLKEEMKSLEVSKRSHQSKLEEVQREFEVERETAQEEARSLRATIDKLERDLDLAASAHNSDKKRWEESMEQLKERFSMEGTEERSNYLKEIKLLAKEEERLREKNEVLLGKQAELERTVTQLTKEKTKLTTDLKELITTSQQGKEEREVLERRLQEAKQQSEVLQEDMRNLNKDLSATKLSYEEALQQHRSTIADRAKEKEEMELALTRAKEAQERLEKKFAEESASLTAEWESRLEDLRSEHASKEENLKTLCEQEKSASQILLRKERAEFDAREKKLIKEKETVIEQLIKEKEKVIEQEQEVVEEFMHKLSEKDAEIQNLEEELQKLRGTIEASIEERQSLVGSHKEREKSMRSMREDAAKYRVLYEKEEVLRKQAEKELERFRKRVKECEHEKAAVEKDLEDAENRVLVSEKERINLEKEWFRCNEQLEDGEKEKRRLMKELQRNERRLDEEVKLKAMLQEEISNLKDVIEKKKQERLKLEEEKWKDEIRSTENSQQQIVLQSHLAKLKEEVQEGESTRKRLEDEVRSLKRTIETERDNEKKEREAQLAERENVRKSIRLLHIQHCELTERLCMSVEEHFTLKQKYLKRKSDWETAERALSHYKIKWQEEKSMKESMEKLYLREKRKKESEERKFDGLNDKLEAEENRYKEQEKQLRECLRRSEMEHRDKVLHLEKTLTKVQGERQKLLLRLIEVEHSLEAEKLVSSSKNGEARGGRSRPLTNSKELASGSSDGSEDLVSSHSVRDTEAVKAGDAHEVTTGQASTSAEHDKKTLEQSMRTNRSYPGGSHPTVHELTRELQATKVEKERIMAQQQSMEKSLIETQRQKSELLQQVEQLRGVVASYSNLRHVATEYQREHEAYLEKIHKLEEKVQIARGEALEWRRAAEVVELRLHAAIADVAEAEKETEEYKEKCMQQAKMLEETEEAVREVASWTQEKDFLVTELDNFRSLAESQEMEISSLKEELRAIRGEMAERVKKTIHAVQDYMLRNKDESLEGENLVQDLSLLEYAESLSAKDVGEDGPIGKKKSKAGSKNTRGMQRNSVPSTKQPTSNTVHGRGEVTMLESGQRGNNVRSETDSKEHRMSEVETGIMRKPLKATHDGTYSNPPTSTSQADGTTSSVLKSTDSGVEHTDEGDNALSSADHEEYRNENNPAVYKNGVNKAEEKSADARATVNQKKERHTTQPTKLKTPSNIMINSDRGSASNSRHRSSIVNSRKERTSISEAKDRNNKHNSKRVHPDGAFDGTDAAILTENLSYFSVGNQNMPHRRRSRPSRLT